jgi:hypothetical protein
MRMEKQMLMFLHLSDTIKRMNDNPSKILREIIKGEIKTWSLKYPICLRRSLHLLVKRTYIN